MGDKQIEHIQHRGNRPLPRGLADGAGLHWQGPRDLQDRLGLLDRLLGVIKEHAFHRMIPVRVELDHDPTDADGFLPLEFDLRLHIFGIRHPGVGGGAGVGRPPTMLCGAKTSSGGSIIRTSLLPAGRPCGSQNSKMLIPIPAGLH